MHPFSFDMVGPTSSTFLVREKFSPLNELIFIEGGLGMIWSAVWLFFASDTPVGNKHISETEREYIRTCKAEEKIQDTRTVSQIRFLVSKFSLNSFQKTPWAAMLKSQGFWCILVSMVTCDFGLYGEFVLQLNVE